MLNKDFNEFINSINNESILHDCVKYLSKSSYNDDSEQQLDFSVAISKSMLEKYHQWLNS